MTLENVDPLGNPTLSPEQIDQASRLFTDLNRKMFSRKGASMPQQLGTPACGRCGAPTIVHPRRAAWPANDGGYQYLDVPVTCVSRGKSLLGKDNVGCGAWEGSFRVDILRFDGEPPVPQDQLDGDHYDAVLFADNGDVTVRTGFSIRVDDVGSLKDLLASNLPQGNYEKMIGIAVEAQEKVQRDGPLSEEEAQEYRRRLAELQADRPAGAHDA